MGRIRILHTADLHMDSPFEALTSGKAAARRAELRELPGKIARVAAKEKVDMILMAGDILDSDSFFRETGEELFRVLRNVPVPVFIAPGNHDYYSLKSPYAHADVPSNVYVFSKNEIEFFDFSDLGFRVFGAGFTDKNAGPLLRRFNTEKKEGISDIMCIHGEVVREGMSGESKYNPVTVSQIESSRMDYIGFGHIHKASGLLKAGDTYYSWPGCPEGRGFDECGEKTVNIVELNDGECDLKTVPVNSRRYETMEIDITGRNPLLAVQMELPDDTVRDIYRIILKGEADSPVNTGAIYSSLSHYFFELCVKDMTRMNSDIWERAGEDSLRGIFLAKMKELYDSAKDDAARMGAENAVRWGLAALDNTEEVSCHED